MSAWSIKMRRAVEVHIQSTLPYLMLDCTLPTGQPPSSLDGYRNLRKLKTLSQRNISVEKRGRAHPAKPCAHNRHFNSSVNIAMPMFKRSITSRWALMAARGWARLILDCRRDFINDRPNRATAAEAPLDEAQERHHFKKPTAHASGAY